MWAETPHQFDTLLLDQANLYDLDELLAFYDFPAEHWVHLRTTNPVAAVPPGSLILTVERVDLFDDFQDEGVDTTPWTGHSDQAALADGIRTQESEGDHVIPFHNFIKRIAKFCRVHGPAATALGSLPQALSHSS